MKKSAVVPTALFMIVLCLQSPEVAAEESTGQVVSQVEVPSVVISAIQQVDIPARVAGALTEVTAEEGEHVRSGQVLASTDTQDADLLQRRRLLERDSAVARAASTIEVDLAEKSLLLAESDIIRARRSREIFARAITDEEIEHRQLVVDQAQLQVKLAEQNQQLLQREAEQAEIALKQAIREVQRCQVIAPTDGVVVELKRRVGEWVEPGEPVARIVQVDRLRAEGFVPASQLALLKRGQSVKLKSSNGVSERTDPPTEFSGILKFVSPEIIAVDGRVRIWAEIDNSARQLHPGMRATLIINVHP